MQSIRNIIVRDTEVKLLRYLQFFPWLMLAVLFPVFAWFILHLMIVYQYYVHTVLATLHYKHIVDFLYSWSWVDYLLIIF